MGESRLVRSSLSMVEACFRPSISFALSRHRFIWKACTFTIPSASSSSFSCSSAILTASDSAIVDLIITRNFLKRISGFLSHSSATDFFLLTLGSQN